MARCGVLVVLGGRHDAEVEHISAATACRVLYLTSVLGLAVNCSVHGKTAKNPMTSLTVPFTPGFLDTN